MSGGTSSTYHTAKEELKKAEAKESGRHGGNVPKDSDVSKLKVCQAQKETILHRWHYE